MKEYLSNLAHALLGKPFDQLSAREQTVIESLADGEPVAANVNRQFDAQLTFGERTADKVAQFGGSWAFIFLFAAILGGWIILNTIILVTVDTQFDPYPYILLNLVLSALAAIQAPVVMMSQNRQAEKDRLRAGNSFEVALKTELAIQQLKDQIDQLLSPILAPDPEFAAIVPYFPYQKKRLIFC